MNGQNAKITPKIVARIPIQTTLPATNSTIETCLKQLDLKHQAKL